MTTEFDDITGLLDDILSGKDPEEKKQELTTDGKEETQQAKEPEPTPQEQLEELVGDGETEDDDAIDIEAIVSEANMETPEPEPEPEAEEIQPIAPPPDEQFTDSAGDKAVPMPTFTDDEVMEALDIRNFGSLVTLTTRRWHAKVKDRKAAAAAAAANQTDAAAYDARKHLLHGAMTELKAVHAALDAARTAHYKLTLPWSTVGVQQQGKRAGARLLPNALFLEYTQEMGKAKLEMQNQLDNFATEYPNLIGIAAKKLGAAFDQREYPSVASIRNHFGLDFDFMPIPKGTDFQGLQDAQAQKLAATLNRKTRTMLENAMQDAWVRLYDTVAHACAKLGNPDAAFHYTLVDKLREQARMLKHLNATSDSSIEEIRAAVEKHLTMHDVKSIRKDDALRKTMAGEAKKILARMEEIADAK